MIHLTSALFPGSGLKIKLVHGGAYQIQEVGRWWSSWLLVCSKFTNADSQLVAQKFKLSVTTGQQLFGYTITYVFYLI